MPAYHGSAYLGLWISRHIGLLTSFKRGHGIERRGRLLTERSGSGFNNLHNLIDKLGNNSATESKQQFSNGKQTTIQQRKQTTMASPKVVLVTGGNNGIGYEIVKALLQSEKAYRLLLGSRSLEKAELAIETLHKECPGLTNTVEVVQVDLTSDESIEKAFEQVKASPGHIDVLINNAGMHTPPYIL